VKKLALAGGIDEHEAVGEARGTRKKTVKGCCIHSKAGTASAKDENEQWGVLFLKDTVREFHTTE